MVVKNLFGPQWLERPASPFLDPQDADLMRLVYKNTGIVSFAVVSCVAAVAHNCYFLPLSLCVYSCTYAKSVFKIASIILTGTKSGELHVSNC